jgi:hypothetical protein
MAAPASETQATELGKELFTALNSIETPGTFTAFAKIRDCSKPITIRGVGPYPFRCRKPRLAN